MQKFMKILVNFDEILIKFDKIWFCFSAVLTSRKRAAPDDFGGGFAKKPAGAPVPARAPHLLPPQLRQNLADKKMHPT